MLTLRVTRYVRCMDIYLIFVDASCEFL